jgi:predicted nucleotidyltransferase
MRALPIRVMMSDPPIESSPRLPASVEAYLKDVVRLCAVDGGPVHSAVLFGSMATGGYVAAASDVDLLLVLRDEASAEDVYQVRAAVSTLEARHGLAKRSHRPGIVEAFADRVTANVRSFFICTRADLLSGDPGRILDLPRVQARFVDRVAIPSIVMSGVTVWGEDLLARVPLPPIRRLDVAKAFFGLFNQALFSAVFYPMLPEATRYAVDALKRSIHNCYFCYHRRVAPLAEEVAFFQQRHGPGRALMRLMALRSEYVPSFGFVLDCLPAIARLHLQTARNNRFPVDARSGERSDFRRDLRLA